MSQAKATLSEEIHASLRRRILTGDLKPGSKLHLSSLSADYGVSLSVLRESVTRLAGNGLVEASPRRGFAVTPLSEDELKDLTRTRVLIETLALRESIEHGDVEWESGVLAAHHRLERTPALAEDGHYAEAFAVAHQAFHESLLSGCGSRRLQAIARELRDCSALYQYWAVELARDADRDIACEHRSIAGFAVARDADRACAALADHIQRTSDTLVRYATEQTGTDPARDDSAI